MTGPVNHQAALQASLAAQNAPGARVRSWIGQAVMPFLVNNAACTEATVRGIVEGPAADVRRSIRARPFAWIFVAGCAGFALATVPRRHRAR
jgi:hypothetical protein